MGDGVEGFLGFRTSKRQDDAPIGRESPVDIARNMPCSGRETWQTALEVTLAEVRLVTYPATPANALSAAPGFDLAILPVISRPFLDRSQPVKFRSSVALQSLSQVIY